MSHEQERLMLAMGHLEGRYIQSAHAPHKRIRRYIPVFITVALIVVFLAFYPYLREVINTNSNVLGGGNKDGNEVAAGNGVLHKPEESPVDHGVGTTVTVGNTTLTMTEVTETTAVFTVVKKDSAPLYAAIFGLRGDILATTEPNYKVDGALIRPNTLRLTVGDETDEVFAFPTAPGTYEVTVDFRSIRFGTYPMWDVLGFYVYTGKDQAVIQGNFSLAIRPPESDSLLDTTPESTVPPSPESDG